MSDYETILYEVEGTRATVTMNRPDNLNGITNAMMRELYDCLNVVARDDSVRVVLFTGSGRGFALVSILKRRPAVKPRHLSARPASTSPRCSMKCLK